MSTSYPPGSTQPKSAGQIRAVLKHVHKHVGGHEAGPLQSGLRDDDWVNLQTFFKEDRRFVRELTDELLKLNIAFLVHRSLRETVVQVPFGDLHRAASLDQRLGFFRPGIRLFNRARRVERLRSQSATLTRATDYVGAMVSRLFQANSQTEA